MRLNNCSIAASYDTAPIFAGVGFGPFTASRSIISRPRSTGVGITQRWRDDRIVGNAVHPGAIATGLQKDSGGLKTPSIAARRSRRGLRPQCCWPRHRCLTG
jgi:hypothetical protein